MIIYILKYTNYDDEWENESVHATEQDARNKKEKLMLENCESTEYEIEMVKLQGYMEPKDHCEKCGCNEFLCGHNARG